MGLIWEVVDDKIMTFSNILYAAIAYITIILIYLSSMKDLQNQTKLWVFYINI
jgi:hypothetical protein